MGKEIEIYIDTEDIGNYLFEKLTRKGKILSEDDLDTLADIFFDYLIDKGVLEEQDDEWGD